jgi:hypothetical protein
VLPDLIADQFDVCARTSHDVIPYCDAQSHRVGVLQDPPNGVSIEAGRAKTHGLPLMYGDRLFIVVKYSVELPFTLYPISRGRSAVARPACWCRAPHR